MKSSLVLAVIATLGAMTGVCHADVLASVPAFASTAQREAGCSVGNFGTSPVAVKVRIFDEAGSEYPVSSSCNEPVEPNFICSAFAHNVPSTAVVSCAVTAGNADKLRADLTFFDAFFNPIRSVDLR